MRHMLKYLRDPGRIGRKLRWLRIYRGPRRDVTVESWNGKLTFDSRDWFIGKYLYVDRRYEPDTISNAMAALERGGWLAKDGRGLLVDIGANIGMITTAVMTHGWFERAVCVEPAPGNLRLLRLNIAQNGLASRVTVLGTALSTEPGELALEMSEINAGDFRIRAPGTPAAAPGAFHEEKRPEIRVPVDTLDHALEEAGVAAKEISLIWMDIQGHEGQCLEGARRTLAAGMPVVTEFWPYGIARSGMSRARYMAIIAEHFTHAHRILDDRVVPMSIAEVDALFDEVRQPNKMTQMLFVKERR
jgi:FkbM family methyltransferase